MLLQPILSAICFVLSVASAKSRPTVYLIRHGEKPANKRDHHLSTDGELRAQCLRHVFGKRSDYNIGYIMAPRPKKSKLSAILGLACLTRPLIARDELTIYYVDGAQSRALFTVQPLARDLGLRVDTHCKRKHVECVAKTVHSYRGRGNILIAWRHQDMGNIAEALGADMPIEYPAER